jgi:hypothetical protein
MKVQKNAGVEQPRENLHRCFLMSVSGEPAGDDGVIVRPDGTVVVGHGVVADLTRAERTDAPSVCRNSFAAFTAEPVKGLLFIR